MRYQALAFLAAVCSVAAQGVTDKIAPPGYPPEGCKPYVEGKFEIGIVEIANNQKRDLALQV